MTPTCRQSSCSQDRLLGEECFAVGLANMPEQMVDRGPRHDAKPACCSWGYAATWAVAAPAAALAARRAAAEPSGRWLLSCRD